MKILIETIPHSEQRYPTVGDWQWKTEHIDIIPGDGEVLRIRVSEMSDWRYEVLVGLHEAIEAVLCKEFCITEEQVDQFDLNFKGEGEPGDSYKAPYHWPHTQATLHEMELARQLRVDWAAYEAEVNAL